MSHSREKPANDVQGGLLVRAERHALEPKPEDRFARNPASHEPIKRFRQSAYNELRAHEVRRPNLESVLRLHSNVSSARSVAAELCSLLSLWHQNASQLSLRRTANDNRAPGPFALTTT